MQDAGYPAMYLYEVDAMFFYNTVSTLGNSNLTRIDDISASLI